MFRLKRLIFVAIVKFFRLYDRIKHNVKLWLLLAFAPIAFFSVLILFMEFAATASVVKVESLEQHRRMLADEEAQIKVSQQKDTVITQDSKHHIDKLYDKYLKHNRVRSIVHRLFDDIKESKNGDVVYNVVDIESIPESQRVSNKYKNRYEKGRKYINFPEKE